MKQNLPLSDQVTLHCRHGYGEFLQWAVIVASLSGIESGKASATSVLIFHVFEHGKLEASHDFAMVSHKEIMFLRDTFCFTFTCMWEALKYFCLRNPQ